MGQQPHRLFGHAFVSALALAALAFLAGCPTRSNTAGHDVRTASLSGTVYGGRQPITSAAVVAYAAATTAAAAPAELGATTTDNSGRFTITFSPAPATGQIVYVTVLGGNAGAGTNSAIGLMTVAGAYCDSGTGGCGFPANVNINELTTVASTAALQRYISFADCSTITGNTQSGTCLSIAGATDLSRVSGTVGNLVDVANGQAATFLTAQPATSTNPVHATLEKMNTLASVLAACVNAAGPAVSGCTNLFKVALNRPGDTLQAAYDIAAWPAVNVKGHALCALKPTSPSFAPTVATAPANWTIAGQRHAYTANDNGNNVSGWRLSPLTGAMVPASTGDAGNCGNSPDPGNCFAAGSSPFSVAIDPGGRFAYVANNGGGNVSAYAIDPATGLLTPVTTGGAGTCGSSPDPMNCFAAGTDPYAIAVDPGGQFAYVANNGSANVSAYTIDASTGALMHIADYNAGTNPSAITLDPGGQFAYVANRGSGNVSAYAIDVSTGALTHIADYRAGTNPAAVTVSPGGQFAYVANNGSGNVSAYTIDASTGTLTPVTSSPFTAGTNPSAVTVDPDGQLAYVANSGSGNVSAYAIDASTGALTHIATYAAGTGPSSVAVDSSGRFLYVANKGDDSVSTYTIESDGSLTPLHVATPFAAGNYTDAVIADPSGRFVYAVNSNCHDPGVPCSGTTGSVSAWRLDSTTGALIAIAGSPVAAGSSAELAASDPSGQFVYVVNRDDNDVQAYRVDSTTGVLTTIGRYATGSGPLSVVVSSDGRYVYVANHTSGNISAYDLDASSGLLTEISGSPFAVGVSTDWVAVDPASRFAYAANFDDDTVSAYTVAPGSSTTPAPGALTRIAGSPFAVGAGKRPRALTVDPSGRYVYVANHSGDDVSAFAIDPATGALTEIAGSPFAADNEPLAIAADPTGRYVFTANHAANTVSVFTIAPTSASVPGALAPVSASSPFPAGAAPASIAVGP